MRDELKNIATIEEYLAGELSPEQVSIIENKIKSDADFAQNVNAQREITNHFKVMAFKDAVQTRQVKYNQVQLLKSILIVIATLFVIGFAVYHFFPTSEKASAEIEASPEKTIVVENRSVETSGLKSSRAVVPVPKQSPSDQEAQSKAMTQKEQASEIDSVDNTIDFLSLRGAFSIPSVLEKDIVDMIVDNSKTPEISTSTRTIWKIEDRFNSYFQGEIIPVKITSKHEDLNLAYTFTTVRGSKLIVTLVNPEGKEIEILNMTERYEKIDLNDQLELDHIVGTWKMHIKTIGQGSFSMKINSN